MIKKRLVWIIPILIVVALFGLQYVNQLQDEIKLPDQGWSRTIHIPVQAGLGKSFAYEDSAGLHLYTYKGSSITHTELTKNLKVKARQTKRFKGDIMRIVGGQGNQFIFKKDFNLYFYQNGTTRLLAKKVDFTAYEKNDVFYTKGRTLYQTNLHTLKSNVLSVFPKEISTLSINETGDLLLITTNDEENHQESFYVHNVKKPGPPHEFANLYLGSSRISFVELGRFRDQLGVLYSLQTSKGALVPYYFQVPESQALKGKPMDMDEKPLDIYFTGASFPINTLRDVFFTIRDQKPTVLFTTEGQRTMRQTSENVYEAQPNAQGRWIAERRSTSPETSSTPFWIGAKNIVWYDYKKGDDVYQMGVASQNPTLIKKSQEIRAEDLSLALSDATLSLTRVLILILLSVLFSVGGLLVYGLTLFAKVELIDNNSRVLRWITMGAFVLGEYLLTLIVMNPKFAFYAPKYLTFPMSGLVYTLVMAGISWLLTQWLKTKQWGFILEVAYFATLFLLMFNFLFGPYYF
ncbi:hypothetical protein ACFO4N_15425 [Camelliibacillus cellulosilyticus]|uniref:Uncharacterized protein n=1 Tax=Camelliibacillus cellulosilyticus TaxID=2174486 RepID=A0ABV9GT20_9BACL